jgi:hypothetical protein
MTDLLLTTGWKNQFNDRLRELVQQSASKLKDKVNLVAINGEYEFLDKVGKLNVRKDNNAFAPVQNFEPSYERRRLSADRFVFDMYLDKNKMRKLVNDSQYESSLVNQMKAAFQRKMDKVIYDCLDATVYTGKGGTVAISAATDGVVTVNATAGTTYQKLREAKRTLASRGWNIQDGYPIHHLITEEELDSYEQELEMTSQLYTGSTATKRDERTGQIISALGINMITFASNPEQVSIDPPIIDVSSTTRKCFMMVGKTNEMGFPGAATLGMERELQWEIVKAPEKHDTWILKGQMNIGAVREHGTAVIIYNTTTL